MRYLSTNWRTVYNKNIEIADIYDLLIKEALKDWDKERLYSLYTDLLSKRIFNDLPFDTSTSSVQASSGDVWFVEPACTELVEVSKRTSTGILYFLDIPNTKYTRRYIVFSDSVIDKNSPYPIW